MCTSARKKKRLPAGSVSGWKRRMPFLIGWTCGNSRRRFRKNSLRWKRNECDGQCGTGKRRARASTIFARCTGIGSRRGCKGSGFRVVGNRKPRAGEGKRSGGNLGRAVPGAFRRRFFRGGFFQSLEPSAAILRSAENCVP